MSLSTRTNPTGEIDVSFQDYVRQRRSVSDAHMVGKAPDYAYGSDFVLQQKIRAIPGFYQLAKTIGSVYIPQEKQKLARSATRVGPNQFPELHEMVVDCARRLGIGIPTLYVLHDPGTINAYAVAYEDDAPLIEVTSALLERFTKDEVKAVIAHECGHIHNNHGIYDMAANLILNSAQVAIPGVSQILSMLSAPLFFALKAWSRAAEVTCDRAGVICSDDKNATVMAQAKLAYGATMGNDYQVNVETLLKQYDTLRATPARLLELESTHPASVRRILAAREFLNSETLYTWRPEWKEPGMECISKQELDARCDQFISVFKSERRRTEV